MNSPYKRKTIIGMNRCAVGSCEHEVKVTFLNNGWNIRVFLNGEINQESRVYSREYIGIEIAHMLRTEDKCGNISGMASSSRDRVFCTPL